MMHTVRGRNFHGPYLLRLRGPAEGMVLSESQARRYQHELCPFPDCACGGGYGPGDDPDSATVVWAHDLDELEGGPGRRGGGGGGGGGRRVVATGGERRGL